MRNAWPVLLLLAACWPWSAVAQQAPAGLDHRRLIADNLTKLFSADARVRNVAVSELRRVPSPVGLTWATCVRISATGMSGKPIAPRTYLVTFTPRHQIADRGAATGQDCAGAKFEPLR